MRSARATLFFSFLYPVFLGLSFPVEAQNLRDFTSLGLSGDVRDIQQVRIPGSGIQIWMTFTVDEGADRVDYNGDGDLSDQVAHVANLRTGEVLNLRIAATRVEMTGTTVLFGVGERNQGNTDLDGDGEVRGHVVHVFNLTTRRLVNLRLRATSFALCGNILAFLVPEEELDLNGDGDRSDAVFHVYSLENRTTRNLELATTSLRPDDVSERLVCLSIREGSESRDLNGDGDRLDTVMLVFDSEIGELRNLGVARPNPGIFGPSSCRVQGPLVYFFGDEESQGQDLNRDGDDRDQISFVYDARDGMLTNLGLAYPRGSEFQDGSRILGNRIILDVSEQDQGFTDLNGDGDFSDRIVYLYNAATKRARSVGIAGHGFVLGSRFLIEADEIESNLTDFNRDGDFFDDVLHVLEPETGSLNNLGVAVVTSSAVGAPDSDLVAFKVDEEAQGERDFDGNGTSDDPEKSVAFVWDGASGALTNLGAAIDIFDPNNFDRRGVLRPIVRGSRVYLPVSETLAGTDLNGDGDVRDNVTHLYESRSGVTVNLDLPPGVVTFAENAVAVEVIESPSTGDLNGDGDLRDRILHASRFEEPYGQGSVNLGVGAVTDVLRINGSTGTVTTRSHRSIDLSLDSAPAGPPGRYILWGWMGRPSQEVSLEVGGEVLGRLVNPTPLQRGEFAFGPFLCLTSPGLPPVVCRGVPFQEIGPRRVPFNASLGQGLPNGVNITIQGLIEDAGAANSLGVSVTNAVVILSRDL